MAIITIARERGAYGRQIAKALADRLHAHFIDKDIVDERMEALGITEKKRTAFDERKPGFFASLTNSVEEYVNALKLVLFDEAKDGNCIILGRGGQMLFKDVPGHISIRLIAPLEERIARVAHSNKLDIEQAKQVVVKVDRNRAGFNSFFFDSEWSNALDYDVVFNTNNIPVPQIVDWIQSMADTFTDIDLRNAQSILANMAMAQKIEHHLLFVRKLPIFFLKVSCDRERAQISGIAHRADVIEEARKAAFIDGITSVNCKIDLEIELDRHYDRHI